VAVIRIGVISDTHGLLRPEALAALRGSDRLIHGGDIGNPDILRALEAIAPLTVVRGNNDIQDWAEPLPEQCTLEAGGLRIRVLHDASRLQPIAADEGIGVVVSGHSHKPSIDRREGVLYVNPGSAGPRRFTLPIAVAEIRVEAGTASARIIELAPGRAA
jgi:putative phosphoesterase